MVFIGYTPITKRTLTNEVNMTKTLPAKDLIIIGKKMLHNGNYEYRYIDFRNRVYTIQLTYNIVSTRVTISCINSLAFSDKSNAIRKGQLEACYSAFTPKEVTA